MLNMAATPYLANNLGNIPVVPTTSGQMGHMTGAQIDKVSQDFEAMFIAQMTEQMFGDSEGTDAFGSPESNDIYKGLLAEQYGKQIAASGGIGIASYVKSELLKLQEA